MIVHLKPQTNGKLHRETVGPHRLTDNGKWHHNEVKRDMTTPLNELVFSLRVFVYSCMLYKITHL